MLSALLLALALAQSTQAPGAPDPLPGRAEVHTRVQALSERVDWRRLDFDERWNQRSDVKAALDSIANVWNPAPWDVSSSRLPAGVMKLGPVSAFLVRAFDRENSAGFLVTEIRAWSAPSPGCAILARRVRIELPGEARQLALAEVRLRGDRIERKQLVAHQSSVGRKPSLYPASFIGGALEPTPPGDFGGALEPTPSFDVQGYARARNEAVARRALDGIVNAPGWSSTALTDVQHDPWWEVDLGRDTTIEAIEVFGDPRAPEQIAGFVVVLFSEDGAELWRSAPAPSPAAGLGRPVETGPACWQALHLRAHSTSSFAPGAGLARALDADPDPRDGWALGQGHDRGDAVVLLPAIPFPGDWLQVEMHQAHGGGRVFGRFSVEVTTASPVVPFVAYAVYALIGPVRKAGEWTDEERRLAEHFLSATEEPAGYYALADADLVRAAQKRLAEGGPVADAPESGTSPAAVERLRAIIAGATDGLTGVERIELAAFLASGPR